MARPRSISDKDIAAIAYDLLMQQGPSGLTFERLGELVGLVPAALVRRFKNKQQLLAAVDRYALELTKEKVEEATIRSTSAIDAIIAQFSAELSFASTLNRFTNGQEFLLLDLRDKNLYTNYQKSFNHRHEQTVRLLRRAHDDGELQGIDDFDELASHLSVLLHGTGHVWAMTQKGSIKQYIDHHVRFALQPYVKTKGV